MSCLGGAEGVGIIYLFRDGAAWGGWKHPLGIAMMFGIEGLRNGTRVVAGSPTLCIDHGSHSLDTDRDGIGHDMDKHIEVNPLDGNIALQAWRSGMESHICVSPFFS